MTSSLWIVPREIACGSFLPALQQPVCVCVVNAMCICVLFTRGLPAWPRLRRCSTKKNRGFTSTINVPRSSHPPLLSFSLAVILPLFLPSLTLSLSEVSSFYWMVQKQNHKPISVTLAMRLDGPNLSPFGAIGSTPVSLKRPLSCSFLFGDNCN